MNQEKLRKHRQYIHINGQGSRGPGRMAVARDGRNHPPGRHNSFHKSIKKLMSFWGRCWFVWGPISAPFRCQIPPILAHRALLNAYQHRKRRFSRNSTKTNRKSTKLLPDAPRKRSQTTQVAPKRQLFRS